MADFYHLDFETYSAANLKKFGAYRYACDESTEILIFAIAKNDEAPLVWTCLKDEFDGTGEWVEALQMFRDAVDGGAIIYAHNAQFEAAICKYNSGNQLNIAPPTLTQWRCTAGMARRAAIPSSLGAAGEFLGLEETKDKEGAALIRKFSIPKKPTKNDPRTRIMPEDEMEAFKAFAEYCRQDVEAERAIHKKLKAFEFKGLVLDSFQFDMVMNDRGVPVNVPALKHVDALINEYSSRLSEQFRGITGLNPTQGAKVLDWMRERGYPFTNLQADNVDETLKNGSSGWSMRQNVAPAESEKTILKMLPVEMTEEAFEALRIRSLVSYAAAKKIPTMLAAVCPDGYVRGTLLWSGAERSHRWSGRIIQPQNFARPRIKGTELAYQMLCEGADIDTIEMVFGPFLEVVVSCIRHFIQWPQGKLNQGDFSSVEGRGAPWLCGGHSKLAMFNRDEPIYETMAAAIFGCSVQQVVDEHRAGNSEKRFIGKQAELGCNYNMGWPKFRGTCEGYNFKPTPQMVEDFKPRFAAQLAAMKNEASRTQPWEEREMKFPKLHWSQLRNLVKGGQFVKRGFTVWAGRSDGSKRAVVDPANPTTQEWEDLTYDDLAFRAVTTWRKNNPEVVAAWKSLDAAAKDALRKPGTITQGAEKIQFGLTNAPGFRALLLKLPSGHNLIYPKAKLVWKGDMGVAINWDDNYNTEIQFWGKIPNAGGKWGWCKTYGGKLLENATQAVCGDFMAHGAIQAAKAGYEAFMLVHDELVGPQYEGQDHKELCRLLCTLPDWAKGMPLAAEGETIPFYKK